VFLAVEKQHLPVGDSYGPFFLLLSNGFEPNIKLCPLISSPELIDFFRNMLPI
jgi:hypothetical protein